MGISVIHFTSLSLSQCLELDVDEFSIPDSSQNNECRVRPTKSRANQTWGLVWLREGSVGQPILEYITVLPACD